MRIFLDDLRMPFMSHREGKGLGQELSDLENWVIVRDYFEFKYLIDNQFDKITLISFDHDLACFENGIEYTGKTAADYLISYCLDNGKKLPDWYVHSDNISGKSNIIGVLLSYSKNVEGKDVSNFKHFNSGIIKDRPV